MGIPWSDAYDPNELVWYFSYGSNLSAEVFEKRRGLGEYGLESYFLRLACCYQGRLGISKHKPQ